MGLFILKNNMRKNDLTIFLTSILVFVCLWIGFNIYHNSVSSTITPSVNIQIAPISPTFDTKIIDELKKRESVTPIFQLNPSTNQTTPTIEAPQTISSSSAQQATSGGSLLQ